MDRNTVSQKVLDTIAALEERAGEIAAAADRFHEDVEAAALEHARRSMDVPPDAKP